MSTAVIGVIEIVIFFGGILGFCWYQLYSLRKSREEDAKRGEDAPAEPAERTREDVFWDTITKKR